jgi:hypothetical protein
MESSSLKTSPSAAPNAPSKRLKKKACRVLESYSREVLDLTGGWTAFLPESNYPSTGHPEEWVRHLARRVIGQALLDAMLVSSPFKAARYSALTFLVSYRPAGLKLRAFWSACAGITPEYVRMKTIKRICEKIIVEGSGNIDPLLLDRIRLLKKEEGSFRV